MRPAPSGIHWAFAPMVDVARDPRWGRMVEGAGEDPFLGAAVAAAQVRGFQGERIGAPERVIAGAKHFAGYGAALGGRDYDEVNLSESELRNVYLPPFAAAIEAGAGNVMTAYMDLDGVPATGNAWLLTDVLRGALGFEGFVVSDANAVRNLVTHGFARDPTDAAARALSAGVDLEMAIADPAYAHLPEAVERGVVGEEALDASVRRVLEAKLRMGLFDEPYVDEDRARAVLGDPGHREVARTAAERSAVLLRNEGELLPLDLRGPRVDRRHRPAGRREAGHAGAVVLRVRPRRDGDGAGGPPAPRRRGGAGRPRARRAPGAAGLPVDVRHCSAATRRRTRRGSTTRRSCGGRWTSHGARTSRWWWPASGRT